MGKSNETIFSKCFRSGKEHTAGIIKCDDSYEDPYISACVGRKGKSCPALPQNGKENTICTFDEIAAY